MKLQFQFTAARTPEQNSPVEKAFETGYNRGNATMHAANVPEKYKVKLCREAYNTVTNMDNFTVITIANKTQTRFEHWDKKLPRYTYNLRVWGEAGVVTLKKKIKPFTRNP